ncbi:MAG: Kelch repeat-containing protein [Anaerolineales bacterium]
MRRLSLIFMLSILLFAGCREGTPTEELLPGATETPAEPTATSAPTSTPEPTAVPTPDLSVLPFTPGPQPNGTFVVQEVQRGDLTGDGAEDFVVISSWKESADVEDDHALPLRVDVLSSDGARLYSKSTWEVLDVGSPSEIDTGEWSLYTFDRLESAEIRELTGKAPPELTVHLRYAGTGAILDLEILSFAGGERELLLERTAYKGGVNYAEEEFVVSQPLYLYNEPNCCPCRVESTTYAWDGTSFYAAQRVIEPVEGAGEEGSECPPFPQPARWESIAVEGPLPPPRRDALLVHDLSRERLVLFGGRSGETALDDTWAFDLQSGTWTEIVPAGAPRPPARFGMVGDIDGSRGHLLMALGAATEGALFNDVWSLDLETDSWREISTAEPAPAPRYGAGGGVAFYNGDIFYVSHGCAGEETRYADTWAFDIEGEAWREVTPAGEVPSARCFPGADVTGPGDLFLFGGWRFPPEPRPLADVWRFDGEAGAWEQLATFTPGPPARQAATLAHLGDRAEAFLFGGLGASDVRLDDVWVLDLVMDGWRELTPEGEGPAPRYGHTMLWVYDFAASPPENNYFVIFGGRSGELDLNDLWKLVPGDQ